MKIKSSRIILLAAAAALAACKNEPVPTYTVGADDNAIVLAAGIADGGSEVSDAPSRAPIHRAGIEDHHTNHLPFSSGTKAALRIDGTWTGHAPEDVTLTTTATIGDETATDSKHNTLTMSPQLYWDDYGTADPANMPPVVGNGRDKGLTIYGAAVNGVTTAPVIDGTTGKQWEALSWELAADQSAGWSEKDLLISNNVRVEGPDDTYKFDARASGKLLEFTHAMSKVTVVLTAGDGFAEGVFVGEPLVTLHGFPTSGTINVTDGTLSGAGTVADIKTFCETPSPTGKASVTRSAIVFPTRTFSSTPENILTVVADGNSYTVTSEKLYKAIHAIVGDADKMQSGKNYILKVRVSKTDIKVTATILNWVDIETDLVEPKIAVDASHGETGDAFNKSYDFYRSLNILTGYDEDGGTAGVNRAARYTYDGASGSWDKTLYWPDHNTHYFFRGVYPIDATVATESGSDVIAVANCAYTEGSNPSDLAIALPRSATDEECRHGLHEKEDGICATTGTIHMNFEYAMSKIEVRLKSTGIEGSNKVTLDEYTTINIIGGYSRAKIQLSDGLHATYVDADKHDYQLTKVTPAATGFTLTTLDAIVPQVLGDDVLMSITVKNANGTYDTYTAQLNKIRVKTLDGTGAFVTEWEHGKHYIYELDVNKTNINISASLTDWITVTAKEDIWF